MKTLSLFLVVLLALLPGAAVAEGGLAPFAEGTRVVTIASGPEPGEVVDAFAARGVGGLLDAVSGEMSTVQTLAQALLMLSSGHADAFFLFYDTMRYVASRNTNYAGEPGLLYANLHLISRTDKAELMDGVDEALAALTADGTMDALWQEHVEDVISGEDPVPVALPAAQEGRPTFIVGVSGDCPPIDYATADGHPAGYNVALLSAIAERTGYGFELVTIESGARYAALSSGRIDLFFWQQSMDAQIKEALGEDASDLIGVMTLGEEFRLSAPYAEVQMGFLLNSAG